MQEHFVGRAACHKYSTFPCFTLWGKITFSNIVKIHKPKTGLKQAHLFGTAIAKKRQGALYVEVIVCDTYFLYKF